MKKQIEIVKTANGIANNTESLRTMLLQTIVDIRKDKMEHKNANAIGNLAKQVLLSARIDLDYAKFARQTRSLAKKVVKSTKLLGAPT